MLCVVLLGCRHTRRPGLFVLEKLLRLVLIIAFLFAEAWSLGKVSDVLGGLATFIIVVLIAMAGIRLIQSQGFRTVQNIQLAMQRNELPAVALLDALIVFIAGVLFVVPGFVSDALALVLLLSGIRRSLARRMNRFMADQNPQWQTGVVIDGEYQDLTEVRIIEPEQLTHSDDTRADKD